MSKKIILETKEIGKYVVNNCLNFIEVVLKEDKSKKRQIFNNEKLKRAFIEEKAELIDEVFNDLRKRPPSRQELRRLQKMIKGMNRNKNKKVEKSSLNNIPLPLQNEIITKEDNNA